MKKTLIVLIFCLGIPLLTGVKFVPIISSPLFSDDHDSRTTMVTQKQFVSTATFSAIGDILLHSQVYQDAEKEDGSYSFTSMLEHVAPYLGESDITFANQETMIGGKELGLSSYPSFNSPVEIAENLQSAGIDIAGVANNHTLDRGEKAVQAGLAHYDRIGLPYVGAYKNEIDANTSRIIGANGIDFGFLSYTYGTNGIPVPAGKEYLVNIISFEKMRRDIENIRKEADVTVVSMHWGVEYERLPNEEQKKLASFAAAQGADIIIGHHPHVLQPIEWIEQKNGRKSLVIYSLGNFLSGQKGLYKNIGGIFSLSVTKNETGRTQNITIHSPRFLPTIVTNQNGADFKVLPLREVDLIRNDEILSHMYQWLKK
ncbi:CapA family protein [Metabacillus lacus]|nr:CapA family protein [Metabacillus lacus]